MAKMMLGEFIYQLRKEKGLSQTELGDLVGVSNKAVSKWETFEANPDLQIVPKLAKVLGVSVDELLNCEKNEKIDDFISPKHESFFDKLEYVSKRKTVNGTPYVHINFKDFRVAKGLIAIGFRAKGLISIGILSMGLLSLGVCSLGLLAFGSFVLGLLGAGAVAVGGVVAGGLAIGGIAIGGAAIGYVAMGGLAIGEYAYTGENGYAIGEHIYILLANLFTYLYILM